VNGEAGRGRRRADLAQSLISQLDRILGRGMASRGDVGAGRAMCKKLPVPYGGLQSGHVAGSRAD
jgi:hypothetical protein